MSTPVRASARDLRALAAIVSEDRPDLPDGEGLPPSLLAEMKGQIRCDGICFMGFDSGRHKTWVLQAMPAAEKDDLEPGTDLDLAHWAHYWDSQPCSHPDRTGDVRSVLKIADFYSARQWRSTGMYCDVYRSLGIAHELQLCLPWQLGCLMALAANSVSLRGWADSAVFLVRNHGLAWGTKAIPPPPASVRETGGWAAAHDGSERLVEYVSASVTTPMPDSDIGVAVTWVGSPPARGSRKCGTHRRVHLGRLDPAGRRWPGRSPRRAGVASPGAR